MQNRGNHCSKDDHYNSSCFILYFEFKFSNSLFSIYSRVAHCFEEPSEQSLIHSMDADLLVTDLTKPLSLLSIFLPHSYPQLQ